MESLDEQFIRNLAYDVHKYIRRDHVVKIKLLIKKLNKTEKSVVINYQFEGKASLFIASQLGYVNLVNYLIEECGADIELRGTYIVQEDKSKHQVTPLWCAAVSDKLEVVKTLIKHGADCNATSDTNSTPVRSACYMTNIDVVKYLVENSADIHKANVNGGTCLINSVQSVELCEFLIEKEADVNAQDSSGNLALHYAIREGRIITVKLLLKHGADPYRKNEYGDDSVHTAAIRGDVDILDYLMGKIKLSRLRQIGAYQLLGTHFVDVKHDILKALQFWKLAFSMKSDSDSCDNYAASNAAYQSMTEVKSLSELKQISSDSDAIYMQSLLIRERILGPNHKDTIFGLMYRGAVYADMHQYQRCVNLWKYAFQLRHAKNEALNIECLFTLQALTKLFWEIHEENLAGLTIEEVTFDDLFDVLMMTSEEIKAAHEVVMTFFDLPKKYFAGHAEEYSTLILLMLHLVNLLLKLISTESQKSLLYTEITSVLKYNPHVGDNQSLLHLACNHKSSVIACEFFSVFPDQELIETLIRCGACVNSSDQNANTPLHLCAENLYNDDIYIPEKNTIAQICKQLIYHGAHFDACNQKKKLAGEDLNSFLVEKIYPLQHVTLKCLAARCIQFHNIPYLNEVPLSLTSFIKLH